MFVDSLWEVLDGDDDERLVSASTGPLDPTDRVAHKVLNTSPHLTLTSPHLSSLASPHLTSPHLPLLIHLTSPHLTLTSLHSPHLTSAHPLLTSPYSPHLTSLHALSLPFLRPL